MKLDQLINQAASQPVPTVTRLLSIGLSSSSSTGVTNSGNAPLLPHNHNHFNYYPKTATTSSVHNQRVNLPPISDILQQAQHYLPPPPQQQQQPQQPSQSVSSYRQAQAQLPPYR